ncbi:hypothetical protein LVD13_12435 [Flavobacteriaceae bacterium D16]|nr:hypothetical protein [Flavobacteriaceae bacterium D16]
MPPKLQNRLKSVLWIILPLILFSFISNRIADSPVSVNDGTYVLTASSGTQKEITGTVAFREREVVSKNGHLLNVLQISFNNANLEQGLNMEFLISVRSDNEAITEGKYYVNRYISGFVSEFNGVFGYANLHSQGEEPYFSKTGHLQLSSKSDKVIKGNMDVSLQDVDGKKLQLQGSFSALREY